MSIHELPFQGELREIALKVGELQALVNPESDLFDALCRIEAILDPFVGTVEWQTPVSLEEMDFRRSLQGMKL